MITIRENSHFHEFFRPAGGAKQWDNWAHVSEVRRASSLDTSEDGGTVRRIGETVAGRRRDRIANIELPEVA